MVLLAADAGEDIIQYKITLLIMDKAKMVGLEGM